MQAGFFNFQCNLPLNHRLPFLSRGAFFLRRAQGLPYRWTSRSRWRRLRRRLRSRLAIGPATLLSPASPQRHALFFFPNSAFNPFFRAFSRPFFKLSLYLFSPSLHLFSASRRLFFFSLFPLFLFLFFSFRVFFLRVRLLLAICDIARILWCHGCDAFPLIRRTNFGSRSKHL